MDEQILRQIFRNNFDCYADGRQDEYEMAMTQDRFIEVMKKCNFVDATNFLNTPLSEQIRGEYSKWLGSLPDDLAETIEESNQLYDSLKNDFIKRLTQRYYPLVGIEKEELLQQLKNYYDVKEN